MRARWIELRKSLLEEQAQREDIVSNEECLEKLYERALLAEYERNKVQESVALLDKKIQLNVMRLDEGKDSDIYASSILVLESAGSELNPLGSQKRTFERIASLLRANPQILANPLATWNFTELDPIVQTIIFSLFSDNEQPFEEVLLLGMISAVCLACLQKCPEPGLFVRQNTVFTKMIAAYAKRSEGQRYLDTVVAPHVDDILHRGKAWGLVLQLDPVKIWMLLHNGERRQASEVADDPEVVAYGSRCMKLLHKFCGDILQDLIESLDQMPYGLRYLALIAVKEAQLKFPDLNPKQRVAIIGGIVFLRYISPAFLPIERCDAVGRANLLWVGKILQNVANNVRFGNKEPYMQKLNDFVDIWAPQMVSYFERVIEVGSLTAHFLSSPKKSGHNKRRTVLQLTLNELNCLCRVSKKSKEEEVTEIIEKLGSEGYSFDPVSALDNKLVLLCIEDDDDISDGSNSDSHQDAVVAKLLAMDENEIGEDWESEEVLQKLEKEYRTRHQAIAAMRSEIDRVSMQVDASEKELASLNQQKQIFLQYLFTAEMRVFDRKSSGRSKTTSEASSKVGPFEFSYRDLEKKSLLRPSDDVTPQMRNRLVIAFSSSSAGTVDIDLVVHGNIQRTSLELDRLVELSMTEDITEISGLTFYTKRFISFLHKLF